MQFFLNKNVLFDNFVKSGPQNGLKKNYYFINMKSNVMRCSLVIVLSDAVRWMEVGSDAASDGVVSSDAYPDKVCKVCIKKQHLLSRVSATDEYQMPKSKVNLSF